MKKKVVWVVVSCWMVAALLLASCAPAVVEEEEEKVTPPVKEEEVVVPKVVVPEKEANMVKWTGKKVDGTVVEKMLEKPRYGGVHTYARVDQPAYFDDLNPSYGGTNWVYNMTHETLNARDWTRGPLGTDEWSAQLSVYPLFNMEVGMVAESWEMLEDDTLVYHIRKGIHWQDKPPVNGRELTADDVVFSLRRMWEVGYQQNNYRYLKYGMNKEGVDKSIYISPTDKWAVVMKCLPGTAGVQTLGASTVLCKIMAPETVAPDYKKSNTDWKKVVGTGPFILQEYVGASSLTYVRNPNYWRHDPFFPENQLPYLDIFKVLIIPDKSTLLAGLRTGKIDNLTGMSDEDAQQLLQTNPELEWLSYLSSSFSIMMRVDKPELPFKDVKVRQALMMGINFQELVDSYYDGKAVILHDPVAPLAEHKDFYIPLEKMPESVQELYGYHPDKAKQLLAEAGYPQGFKTEILCWKAEDIDLLTIVKEYWAKIGVDLKLDVREYSIFETMKGRKTYTQMIVGMGGGGSSLTLLTHIRSGGWQNLSMVSDAYIDELYRQIQLNYDMAKIGKLYATPTETRPNMITYMNEQAYYIVMPAIYSYVLWQPWLKGYEGAINVHYWGNPSWAMYVWVDQELKKAMGH